MALLSVLLPGTARLLAAQADELPQKDELCGAFWGLLALRAAGISRAPASARDPRLDQDAVALAAGTALSPPPRSASLPPGEAGRDDFRLTLAVGDDRARCGTSASGLARAITELSEGALEAVPAGGAWSAHRLSALIASLAALPGPVTAIANVRTGRLWNPRATAAALVAFLESGDHATGPPSDWDAGHFVGLGGVVGGRGGTLAIVLDSYASRGAGGVHLQPLERLAAALAREGEPPGGVLSVVGAAQAGAARAAVRAAGLRAELWDNGSADAQSG